jgi:hypothetical protein
MSQTAEQEKRKHDMMYAQPQKEHRWLQKLVGDWTFETEAQPEYPSSRGTETIRAVGELWVQAEGRGTMPNGDPATTIMTLGYDPEKKRFVGTWLGSMMTFLWVYDGELDAAGRTLTLDTHGPSMDNDGSLAKYQDIIEFKSDDHRILTARGQKKDGTWQQVMKTEYRRRK